MSLATQIRTTLTLDTPDDDIYSTADTSVSGDEFTAYVARRASISTQNTVLSHDLTRMVRYRSGASTKYDPEFFTIAQKSKVEIFAQELYDRLTRVKRRMDGLEDEEERGSWHRIISLIPTQH